MDLDSEVCCDVIFNSQVPRLPCRSGNLTRYLTIEIPCIRDLKCANNMARNLIKEVHNTKRVCQENPIFCQRLFFVQRDGR